MYLFFKCILLLTIFCITLSSKNLELSTYFVSSVQKLSINCWWNSTSNVRFYFLFQCSKFSLNYAFNALELLFQHFKMICCCNTETFVITLYCNALELSVIYCINTIIFEINLFSIVLECSILEFFKFSLLTFKMHL